MYTKPPEPPSPAAGSASAETGITGRLRAVVRDDGYPERFQRWLESQVQEVGVHETAIVGLYFGVDHSVVAVSALECGGDEPVGMKADSRASVERKPAESILHPCWGI